MNTLRVSCWHFSDKDFTSWVSGSICVRFPTPLHCTNGLTKAPWSLTVPPAASVKPDSLLLGKMVCNNRLKYPRLYSFILSTEVSKGARTFGRRSTHFREQSPRLLGQIQVHSSLKTVLRPSLLVRKPSHGIGVRFREKSCAPSGEAAFPFLVAHLLSSQWTQGSAGSVLWRVIRDESDGDTWRFSRDRMESIIRCEGEALNGIEH